MSQGEDCLVYNLKSMSQKNFSNIIKKVGFRRFSRILLKNVSE